MTMRRLTRLWKTLDALPDAASDQRDWVVRLGDEWSAAAPLLRRTGRLAEFVNCPSPGGADCPRRVVRHPDGRIRAVCGERPAVCDSLDLTKDDIAILALDRAKLAAAITKALTLADGASPPPSSAVFSVGRHDVYAGRGIAVFLALPGPRFGDSIEPFRDLAASPVPTLLLTPTSRSLGGTHERYLDGINVTRLALDDLLVADATHRIVGTRPAPELLAEMRNRILGEGDADEPVRAWSLPPDATWEQLAFEFIAAEVLNVRFRGETRRFEPEQLGMKNAKNGRPTNQWILLQSLAAADGQIGWGDSNAASTVKKQKQILIGKLQDAFGIAGDPIPWDTAKSAYVAKFAIRGDVIDRGQASRRRR